MAITTTNFVSVGFTLKVWRNWVRARMFKLFANGFRHRNKPDDRIIWIFGSGRSGTTWLMELLQRGYRLHSVFEYFHGDNPALAKEKPDSGLRFADDISELGLNRSELIKAASGSQRNAWIHRSNPVISLRRRRGVVLKDVAYRLQHSPALLREVPNVEPVLILRQPSAMLRSLMTSNEIWKNKSLFNPEQISDLIDSNRDVLTDWAIDSFERGISEVISGNQKSEQVEILRWGLHNLSALERLSDNPKLRVVVYEQISVEYLEQLFGPMVDNPKFEKRSRTDWGRKPAELEDRTLAELSATLKLMGLSAFVSEQRPWELDLEALIADYRKPASDRLTPRFMR